MQSFLLNASRPRGAAVMFAVMTALAGGVFAWANYDGANGTLVFPLDDAYIHLQYARQLAAGRFLQYTPGAMPSTGATSLLFILVLAPFFWLAPSLGGWVVIEFLISGACLYLAALGAYSLVRPLAAGLELPDGERLAALAGTLVILNGPTLWLTFSGMETLLFVSLMLWAFVAFTRRRLGWLSALLALVALVRPEGLWLVVLFAVVELVMGGRLGDVSRRYAVPLAAGGLPYGVNYALTGHASAAGFVAKSWFNSVPFYPRGVLETILRYWGEILAVHLNGGGSSEVYFTPPLTLAIAAYGLYRLMRSSAWQARAAALALSGWLLGGALLVATLSTAFWHYGRYELPLVVLTLAGGVLGGAALVERARLRWPIGRLLAGASLLWSLWSVAGAWAAYSLATYTFQHQQRVLAEWAQANLPGGASVAVHDVGGLTFLTELTTFDLIGLTNGSPYAFRDGPGATFELLESLPAGARPQYFASYPLVPPVMAYLGQTRLLGDELFAVRLDSFSRFTSADAAQSLYAADWSLADLGDRPYQPDVLTAGQTLRLVDQLDVADLADEAAHGYRWRLVGEPPGFASEVHQFAYRADAALQLIDGGRALNGGDELRIRTQPGEDLMIVARLNAITPGAVRVTIDGRDAGIWRYAAAAGEWQEASFWITGDQVTGPSARLGFEAVQGTRHVPYYYWFYQGPRASVSQPQLSTPIAARFGSVARLLAYELARTPVQLELRLAWQALAASPVPLKVFVHLRDDAQNVLAQDDHEPYFGLRPTTLWETGERINDTYRIPVPAGLPAGAYGLWLGMYEPESGQRLTLTTAEGEALDSLLVTRIQLGDE